MNRFDTLFLALFVTTLFGSFQIAAGSDYHIALSGNDGHAGTQAKPFRTLDRARDEIRVLKQDGPLAEQVRIFVHGGTYLLKESLVFDARDSGTPDAPIVWQTFGDETVRLCGGPPVSSDAFQGVADQAIRSRLDAKARGNVLQADLQALGIRDLGSYPDAFRGVPAVPELFFNDQRMTLARWPNEGWATIAKIIDSGSVPRNGDKSARPGIFAYDGDRPTRWDVAAGVWLQGYWCYDWYEETIKIKSIDREQRQVTMARPAHYSIKQGNPSPRRYRAMNVLAELDRPGEFYIDRTTGQLYFWPPAEMKGARIVLSTLNAPLVRFENATNITLRGFHIEAGLGDGIAVTAGRGIRIESCAVRNIRQLGIRISGGSHHAVAGCSIHDTGTGGLLLDGGDRKTLTPGGHEALNNHIWRFSQHQLTYASGITLSGVGNRAAHNRVHDAPHMAVAISGNDHIFELNVVHDVCTASDDAGALYKGRNPSCRGNVIRHNFWRDIGSPMGHGTAAVYFDDGDGGDTVVGNIFLRCGHPGRGSFGTVFSHGGHDITAENNIFIDCKRPLGSAPWNDKRWKAAVDGGGGCQWQRRLLEEVDITRPPYTTHYPALVGFMDPHPGQVRVNRARNNVLVRCDQTSSGNWQVSDQENWITDKDPGFMNAQTGDYRLKPNSEVFKRLPGFKPIPFDRMGPQ